jgi:ABC-2 type transport system ATP-binding protein
MTAILAVQNLVKKYGDFAAVNGVTFDIREGEVFSLLGPNGAGKTTTISVLSTLYPPTSGDALISGHSITREPMAVKQVIGIVPQELARCTGWAVKPSAAASTRCWNRSV